MSSAGHTRSPGLPKTFSNLVSGTSLAAGGSCLPLPVPASPPAPLPWSPGSHSQLLPQCLELPMARSRLFITLSPPFPVPSTSQLHSPVLGPLWRATPSLSQSRTRSLGTAPCLHLQSLPGKDSPHSLATPTPPQTAGHATATAMPRSPPFLSFASFGLNLRDPPERPSLTSLLVLDLGMAALSLRKGQSFLLAFFNPAKLKL